MILAPGGERPAHGINDEIEVRVYAHWRLMDMPGLEAWADLRVKRALMETMRRNRRASDEGCRP